MRLRFSRRAERDLEDIADFIARGNPARAVSYIRELRMHCRRLLVFPQAAPLRPELGEGVRLSVFGRYAILYLVHDEVLEIRRVVHGARDLDRMGRCDVAEYAPLFRPTAVAGNRAVLAA